MKKLLTILFSIICAASYGQYNKTQIYSKIDGLVLNVPYMRSLFDSLTVSVPFFNQPGSFLRSGVNNTFTGNTSFSGAGSYSLELGTGGSKLSFLGAEIGAGGLVFNTSSVNGMYFNSSSAAAPMVFGNTSNGTLTINSSYLNLFNGLGNGLYVEGNDSRLGNFTGGYFFEVDGSTGAARLAVSPSFSLNGNGAFTPTELRMYGGTDPSELYVGFSTPTLTPSGLSGGQHKYIWPATFTAGVLKHDAAGNLIWDNTAYQPLSSKLTTLAGLPAGAGVAGYKVQLNSGGTDYEIAPQLANPATTAEDLLKYTGTAFARIPVGSNGNVLTVTGGVVGWAAASGGVTPAALTKTDDTNVTLTLGGTPSTALLQATSLTLGWTGRLALSRLAQGSGLSILGVTGSSTADYASIAGTTDQVARINGAGTAFAFGSIDLSKSAAVGSSILGSTNGGAGAISGLLKANGSGTVTAATPGTDYLAPTGSGTGLTGVALLGTANTFTVNNIFQPTVTTGTGATAGMQVAANSLTTGNGVDISTSSGTTGTLVNVASTSTAANSNTLKGLNVVMSGANSNTTQTVTGIRASVTNTGTSSANVALLSQASGATSNYAGKFEGGVVVGDVNVLFQAGEALLVKQDKNGSTLSAISNTTNGTGSRASLIISSQANLANNLQVYTTPSSFTTSGMAVASTAMIESNVSAGLNIGTDLATQLSFWTNNVKRLDFSSLGTGTLTGATLGTLTASTEYNDLRLNYSNVAQFSTGALTTERTIRIDPRTYSAVGASVITTASTLSIGGAPTAGTNVTITNPYALNVELGAARFGGSILTLGGLAAPTTDYSSGVSFKLNDASVASRKIERQFGSGNVSTSADAAATQSIYETNGLPNNTVIFLKIYTVIIKSDGLEAGSVESSATWRKDNSGTLTKVGDASGSATEDIVGNISVATTSASTQIQATVSRSGTSGNFRHATYIDAVVHSY